MKLRYDEFELTESAYRHGFDDEDFAQLMRNRFLILRNRRGKSAGYELFGRNNAGEHLLAAARLVEFSGNRILKVFHLGRMNSRDRRRFERETL